MPPQPQPVPRPDWEPLPHKGCIGVEHKVLLMQPPLALALLKFAPHATIHEHPAAIDIDVICLEGEGMTSISGEASPFRAGERVRWPAGHPHRLWTEDSEMMTLMVEHLQKG